MRRNSFRVYEKRQLNKVLLLRRKWPAASLELSSPWRIHFGSHPGRKGRHGSHVTHPLAHITATEPVPAVLQCGEDQGNDLWFTLTHPVLLSSGVERSWVTQGKSRSLWEMARGRRAWLLREGIPASVLPAQGITAWMGRSLPM